MLLTLNAWWKSTEQILREGRGTVGAAPVLVLLALVALAIAAFVVWALL